MSAKIAWSSMLLATKNMTRQSVWTSSKAQQDVETPSSIPKTGTVSGNDEAAANEADNSGSDQQLTESQRAWLNRGNRLGKILARVHKAHVKQFFS